jgi:protoporphyrinogen oxidase
MAEGISAAGNTVRLGAGVSQVLRQGSRVTGVVVTDDRGCSDVVEAAQFVSSIPLTVLCRILEPAAPPDVLAAADLLTFRNVITVNLMLDREKVTDDTWLYVHDRNILFGRLHEPKNWSVDMVPEQTKTSIVAEYFCSFGDAIWSMTDDALVELTVTHLVEDLGFVERGEVLGGFAVRAPRAYPSYTIGYERALAVLKDYVASLDNLQIIGRYGTFRYNNADHSVETGLLAARNVLGGHHDIDDVNAEKEYHEIRRIDGVPARRARPTHRFHSANGARTRAPEGQLQPDAAQVDAGDLVKSDPAGALTGKA